jgi:hypothetical protein
MHRRVIFSFVLSLCWAVCGACGGQLYNVAPLPSSPPPDLSTNNGLGANLDATALDGDQSLERFGANLPLAGVIVVDLRLTNRTSAVINTGSLKFELRNASGKPLKPLTPKNALKRVMKFYGNSLYRIDARQRTIESYEAIALPLTSAIASQEERRGLLFFKTERGTIKLEGLTLLISGGAAPINIKLN